MRVESSFSDGNLELKFEPDKKDKEHMLTKNIKMNDNLVVFVKTNGLVTELHPDQIALATILICNPFVGKELVLPCQISEFFHKAAMGVISRYKIFENYSSDIIPMNKQNRDVPSIAFSGGADSVAALSLMPRNTIPVFLKRPEVVGSKYDSDAAIEACYGLKQAGYDVKIIESNLEMIRDPMGFPTDLAHAVPIILMAEKLSIESISFGTIMESGYGIGHEKFYDYSESAHLRFFGNLFAAVGVHLSMPVIGISEVGTSIICEKTPFGHFSQSCIRGTWMRPCMSCWKCFRKELLAMALGFSEDRDLVGMMETNEVQLKLSAFPISHENVIIYALQRLNLEEHPYLRPVVSKLDMSVELDFLEKWYPQSIELVSDSMRNTVRSNIFRYLGIMSPLEERNFRGWDMREHLDTERSRKAQERLTSFWQDFSSRFGK